jgi:hypothetical protein
LRFVGAVISGLCLATARLAAAQPSLDFPAECGSASEFESEVARRLGKLRLPATSARIERDGQGYRLSMSVGGERRELRDRDCRELFRAAVVVAVAIAVSEAEPSRKPQTAPSPKVAKEPAPLAPQAVAPRSVLSVFVGASGGVTLGVVPGVVPSFELEAKLFAHRFGAALAARYVAPGSSRDAANRGVEVRAAGASVLGLFQPIPSLEARLGAALLRSYGTGLGSPAQQSDAAWAGGLVAGLVVYPLRRGRFWVGAGAEGEWHLVRSRFEILNYGEVFRMPRFGGSVTARLGLRLF